MSTKSTEEHAADEVGSTTGDRPRTKKRLPLRKVREWQKGAGYFLLSIGSAVLLWELFVRILDIPLYLLPPPTGVIKRVFEEWSVQLFGATLVTYKETLAGFAVAIAVGIPLAILITYSKLAARLLYPLMVSSQVVPKVAIAPLFVIWFGFGIVPKIVVAFLITFFVIVIDTTVGLNGIDPKMLHLSRSMGASELATFRKVRLPNALPNIFGALKVGVTLAVVGAVVGEFVGSDSGLGYLLLVATGNLDTPLAFASIVMMAMVGLSLFAIVQVVERLVLPWQQSMRLEEMVTGKSI